MSAMGALKPWLPLLAAGLPLLFALLVAPLARAAKGLSMLWLALLPAVPAIALALSGNRAVHGYPGLLIGLRLGLDDIGAVFLLFTAFLWAAAGAYANYYIKGEGPRRRFFFFHLLAMSGNFGVILAHDIAGFYMFFALLTFSAYGLVIHDGTGAALRAGRVYIAMAVVGEALLAAGFFLAADAAGGQTGLSIVPSAISGSSYRDIIIALLISGFGIKAGLVVLHVWLPLAHPVAPAPASALLSGAMIKAGLLGLIRFLPLGIAELPGWGWFLIAAGLFGAFYGAALGSLQDDKKTILAYSSVSQMGIMAAALGLAFLSPGAWPTVLAAILVLAAHHAFAKGALFLSTGLAKPDGPGLRRALFYAGILLPALALAGAPFTSGVIAKTALKESLFFLPAREGAAMGLMLLLSSVATSVIMARFVMAMSRAESLHGGARSIGPGLALPWAALVILAPVAFLLLSWGGFAALDLSIPSIISSVSPITAGALAYAVIAFMARRTGARISIPPGDLLVLIVPLLDAARKSLKGAFDSPMDLGRAVKTRPFEFLAGVEKLEARLLDGSGWLLFLALAAGLAFIFIGAAGTLF